jgi:transcriptional regulator with XRE-family HTH domain
MTTTLPLPAQRSLQNLGVSISKARRRRAWDQKAFAAMMGVWVSTVKRLESDNSGVALHTLIRAMLALQLLDDFDLLLEAPNDRPGLIQQDENLPQRIRKMA